MRPKSKKLGDKTFMELLIVTGMSGAGKSLASNVLEDIGYYCVDNMPPALICSFLELSQAQSEINKLSIITDVRGGVLFEDITDVLSRLDAEDVSYKILFMDASDDVLVRRYKELRRRHPLFDKGYTSIPDAVAAERIMLRYVRERADYVIDTSVTSTNDMKELIRSMFLGNLKQGVSVQCCSFGYKYGVPVDADLIFDVRCLPNPFYVQGLKSKTGLDKEVYDYVLSFEESRGLLSKITDLLDYSMEYYRREGKTSLNIAFGCTGGKHRSVTFAENVAEHMNAQGYSVSRHHRDITK